MVGHSSGNHHLASMRQRVSREEKEKKDGRKTPRERKLRSEEGGPRLTYLRRCQSLNGMKKMRPRRLEDKSYPAKTKKKGGGD